MNALVRFFRFLSNFFAVRPLQEISEKSQLTPTPTSLVDNNVSVSVSTPVALEMSATITFEPVIEKIPVIAETQQQVNPPSVVTADNDYRLKSALLVPNPKGGSPRKAKFRSSSGRIMTANVRTIEDDVVELVRRPGSSPFRRRLDRIRA